MGDSYRIRTEIGVNKSINIQLDQDFEFLEILSLKIQQVDLYDRTCADYGVLVGRVTANNGLGVPNARVSVFIPVDSVDESNPLIQGIYPYKSPNDKNEDGYRYNLLPYEKSYTEHAATGTLPTRLDVLTGSTVIDIFDKYYRFTAKTNESGDYMIFGVPLGFQNLVMDVDLSDIGEFSLTPQDLIRMGVATDAQVSGNKFKSSTDLNSLPQIVNIIKSCNIEPLWGDPEICQISINRVDFDLRDDANIDIQPTSVFMGSIFSSSDNMRVRPGRNSTKIKDNLGNLCGLIAGPGQILCLRQTIQQGSDGNPIIEQYRLEKGGNVIDGNGVWLIEVPMNLDYITTNQFGERIISNDPTIGIPTKGKYRFKIKWDQPRNVSQQVKRPYYLVPNVKEYGWQFGTDPNSPNANTISKKQIQSSYYFGLDWSGYTDGFLGQSRLNRLNEIINCEDTFYQFVFNKVYTVASLIDEYKDGGRGNFIGIKEINDDSCTSTVNKFPVNEGFRNFDLIYFIFSVLLYVVNRVMVPVLIVAHYVTYLYNIIVSVFCWAFSLGCGKIDWTIRFPMMTYPNCEACDCKDTSLVEEKGVAGTNGVLSYVSDYNRYYDNIYNNWEKFRKYEFPGTSFETPSYRDEAAKTIAQALAGNPGVGDPNLGKLPKSDIFDAGWAGSDFRQYAINYTLPLGERINLFNTRKNYFDGINKIKVSYEPSINVGKYHFDNTITVLSRIKYSPGDLLTTVNPYTSDDPNFFFSATTNQTVSTTIGNDNQIVLDNEGNTQVSAVNGITGSTRTSPVSNQNLIKVDIKYAVLSSSETQVSYLLPPQPAIERNIYPMDREYFQVITAITVSDAFLLWGGKNVQYNKKSIPSILLENADIQRRTLQSQDNSTSIRFVELSPYEYFEDMENQYVLILQRGVDPYSPKYNSSVDLSTIFGLSDGNIIVKPQIRLNIPIQKLSVTSSQSAIQKYDETQMMFPSYFFLPGNEFSGFTSSSVGYYGSLDSTKQLEVDGKNYVKPFDYLEFTPLNVKGARSSESNLLFNRNGGNIGGSSSVTPSPIVVYNVSDDLSGGALMADTIENAGENWREYNFKYYSKVDRNINFKISNRFNNVMRTDRLPSSDSLNGLSWDTNPALLQQNNNFIFYVVEATSDLSGIIITGETTGAQQVSPDIEDQVGGITVLQSFNCENMVSLDCYQGIGSNFGINQNCVNKDSVENGCYVFLRRPVRDLDKDLKALAEWSYRFRFFYGLCRGVLSESFTNNWVNGSLFMFPIQVNTYFDSQNQPFSVYPNNLIYFDELTNNFYVRSSPFSTKFIGLTPLPTTNPVNQRNLLFPTTIVDLGMKDRFYAEIIFEPYANGYIVDRLDPTSYGDTSDLLNLFVISRITDENTLQQFISLGNNSIAQLFSRGPGNFPNQSRKRIDGDLAQNLSINSEVGVLKFSPEFYDVPTCDSLYCSQNSCLYSLSNLTQQIQNYSYFDESGNQVQGQMAVGSQTLNICANLAFGQIVSNQLSVKLKGCCNTSQNPVQILGTAGKPTMAIWFSSTTEDLQMRDYLTPGRITFRDSANNTFPYNYGIKSQTVPFYKWRLNRTNPIFGDEQNNWATSSSDILSKEYQSLDRIPNSSLGLPSSPYFFSKTSPTNNTDYYRGYIFSVDSNGNYSTLGAYTNNFVVGAPFHFYFGIIKGQTAMDLFKSKYLADE